MHSDSAELLRAVQANDEKAAAELFARYVPRLQSLVRSRLGSLMARRVDSDDVVQSAMRSFFVRTSQGEFCVDQSGDLWRLLATITLRKVSRAAKRHRAAKRSVEREVPLTAEPDADCFTAREPTPADAAAAAEELVWLMKRISPANRQALQLRLQGCQLIEIAERLQRSERTIRRWLDEARELMRARMNEFDAVKASPEGKVALEANAVETVNVAMLDPRNYVLHRLIGAGGVCKVYEATERSSGKALCIKVLRKQFRHQRRYVNRFFEEHRLTAKLAHPGIVATHGIGQLPAGGYFLALNLMAGRNLQESIESRQPMPIEAAQIVAQIADAIAYAHSVGVAHCDLKPANVLIDDGGKAWLIDFGFARELNADAELSADRQYIAGTAAYLAPEQIEARIGPIGIATDVHGLGAILFAILTGTPPFGARTLDELELGSEGGEIDFELLRGVSENLAGICRRCLARSPRERFLEAAEVATVLRTEIAH